MINKDELLKSLRLLKDYEIIISENNKTITSLNDQINQLQADSRKNQTYISGLESELKTLQPAYDLLNDSEINQIFNDIQTVRPTGLAQSPKQLPPPSNPLPSLPVQRASVKEELKKIGKEFKTSWHHHKN